MIRNPDEANVTLKQLEQLRTRYARIEADNLKNHRAKAMELAGLQSMIEQLEAEWQADRLNQIELSLRELRTQLGVESSVDWRTALVETLDMMEQLVETFHSTNLRKAPTLDKNTGTFN